MPLQVLKHQADYENLRRWLGFDILTGKFSKDHPLWLSFLNLGVDPLILNRASEIRVHIDLIGVNHYLTSHRYLDAHYSAYPPTCKEATDVTATLMLRLAGSSALASDHSQLLLEFGSDIKFLSPLQRPS